MMTCGLQSFIQTNKWRRRVDDSPLRVARGIDLSPSAGVRRRGWGKVIEHGRLQAASVAEPRVVRHDFFASMFLEAVTVSENYADYLEACAVNKQHFDRWTIVTVPGDSRTIGVCIKYGLEYVFTHRLHEDGALFAKSKAINDGLATLEEKDWILILDADILLPATFREDIEAQLLSPECLYGLRSRTVFMDARALDDNKAIDDTDQFLDKNRLPAGFFQLFHASHGEQYPEISRNAEGDDIVFARQWPPNRRVMLDMPCVHLGLPMMNWSGRRTSHFSSRMPAWSVMAWKGRFVRRAFERFVYTNIPGAYVLKNTLKLMCLKACKLFVRDDAAIRNLTEKIRAVEARACHWTLSPVKRES